MSVIGTICPRRGFRKLLRDQMIEERPDIIVTLCEMDGREGTALFFVFGKPMVKPSQVVVWVPISLADGEFLHIGQMGRVKVM
jgi:hypothetical protein